MVPYDDDDEKTHEYLEKLMNEADLSDEKIYWKMDNTSFEIPLNTLEKAVSGDSKFTISWVKYNKWNAKHKEPFICILYYTNEYGWLVKSQDWEEYIIGLKGSKLAWIHEWNNPVLDSLHKGREFMLLCKGCLWEKLIKKTCGVLNEYYDNKIKKGSVAQGNSVLKQVCNLFKWGWSHFNAQEIINKMNNLEMNKLHQLIRIHESVWSKFVNVCHHIIELDLLKVIKSFYDGNGIKNTFFNGIINELNKPEKTEYISLNINGPNLRKLYSEVINIFNWFTKYIRKKYNNNAVNMNKSLSMVSGSLYLLNISIKLINELENILQSTGEVPDVWIKDYDSKFWRICRYYPSLISPMVYRLFIVVPRFFQYRKYKLKNTQTQWYGDESVCELMISRIKKLIKEHHNGRLDQSIRKVMDLCYKSVLCM